MSLNAMIMFFTVIAISQSSVIYSYELTTHAKMTEITTMVVHNTVMRRLERIWEGSTSSEIVNEAESALGVQNIPGSMPVKLMIAGSVLEDDGIRPLNHFFDPHNNEPLSIGSLPQPFKAYQWAGGNTSAIDAVNDYTWRDAMKYLEMAIVSDSVKKRVEQQEYLFRSLGSIVHIAQDMAQPSHVRNDPHIGLIGNVGPIEIADRSSLEEFGNKYFNLEYVHPDIKKSLINVSATHAPTYTKFFVESENITCPFEGIESSYTCSNNRQFFSDDTIFSSYDNPNVLNTDIVLEDFSPAPWIVFFAKEYVVSRSVLDPLNSTPLRLAVKRSSVFSIPPPFGSRYYLNDYNVLLDNMKVLSRRAISTSAGLIEYFFRGDLRPNYEPRARVCSDSFLGITNISGSNFSGLQNNFDLSNGTLALYAKNPSGNMLLIKQIDVPGPVPVNENLPPMGLSLDDQNRMANWTETQLYTEDTHEIALLFKGKIGEEEGVIGLKGTFINFCSEA